MNVCNTIHHDIDYSIAVSCTDVDQDVDFCMSGEKVGHFFLPQLNHYVWYMYTANKIELVPGSNEFYIVLTNQNIFDFLLQSEEHSMLCDMSCSGLPNNVLDHLQIDCSLFRLHDDRVSVYIVINNKHKGIITFDFLTCFGTLRFCPYMNTNYEMEYDI